MKTKKKLLRAATCILPVLLVAGIAAGAVSCTKGKTQSETGSSQLPSSAAASAQVSVAASSAVTPVSSAVSSAAASKAPSSVAVSSAAASKAPSSVVSSKAPVSSVASKAPVSSVASVVSGTGIYKGVTWRSPYAETADIMKHGRELMLLNNYYELPEDFQWNLVRWSNGESVDAMSLNSSAYDKVQAVDAAAYQPLKDMFAAAKAAGVPLQLVSPYRSIDLQDRLFGSLVTQYMNQGYSKADAAAKANVQRTYSGTSEHNTGLGFDILESGNWYLSTAFDQTAQFRWLSEHAAEYGFILRYAADKTKQTGIMYEPWHYRYVGQQAAQEIRSLGMCLEEYIAYLEK